MGTHPELDTFALDDGSYRNSKFNFRESRTLCIGLAVAALDDGERAFVLETDRQGHDLELVGVPA